MIHRKWSRLTSNRPTEAVVCWVCITSVRAHICWMLEETVGGSGRSWDYAKMADINVYHQNV